MIPENALKLIGPRTAAQIAEALDADGQNPEWAPVRERAMLLSARLGIPSRISNEPLARYARSGNRAIARHIAAGCERRGADPEWLKLRDLVEHLYSRACLESAVDPVRMRVFSDALRDVLGLSPAVALYAVSPAERGQITPFDRVVSRGGHAAKVELAGGHGYRVEGRDLAEGNFSRIFFAMSEDEAVEEMHIHMAEIGCRHIEEVSAVPVGVCAVIF